MNFLKKLLKAPLSFMPAELLASISFETRSFLRDSYNKPLKVNSNRKNYINLGSGPVIVDGLINIDFYGTPGVDYSADLRKNLKIPTSSIDGIVCEHTMEHLTYSTVDNLLGECYRILKPLGIIRIILPDVSLFVDNYASNNRAWFDHWQTLMFTNSGDPVRSKRKLASPMQAISFITQEYGHVSAWDYETLRYYLEKNGFQGIVRSSFREGQDPNLLIDHEGDDRKFVSLYVEAYK